MAFHPGVGHQPHQRYADLRLADRGRLLAEFEPMWQELNTRETRRKLGKVIAKL